MKIELIRLVKSRESDQRMLRISVLLSVCNVDAAYRLFSSPTAVGLQPPTGVLTSCASGAVGHGGWA